MAKISLNPPSLFASSGYGFSQVVVAGGRKTVYISGQTAWDPEKNSGGAELAGQMGSALRNIRAAVEATGGTIEDLVALRIYVVNYRPGDAAVIAGALRAFFRTGRLPAATWVGVQALATDEFLVEIEATAVLD
jgi:2-iminobutanoate/2-iminopropanoate deaminase